MIVEITIHGRVYEVSEEDAVNIYREIAEQLYVKTKEAS